jgi:tRNA(Ile)-lysidine synthase
MKGDYSFIVLAHHADDNIETLLMNFFRGTGLQGLTGMPAGTLELIRPLLNTRKKDILDFANQHQLQWVEDASNKSVKYTRNFFRNELIPSIKKVYPQAEENLLDTISRMKKINGFYQQAVSKALESLCEKKGEEIRVPVRKLKKLDYQVLIYEWIKPFGFGEKQVEEVIRLMDSESGRYIKNNRYQIIRHGLWLILAPLTEAGEMIVIDEGREQVSCPGGSLELKKIMGQPRQIQTQESIAQLDARDIEFPLVLRRWKAGDYFYPLGMRKKKKLARFFIDQKLPKNQKENTWVLESNKRIIWVLGMRIDERFKITNSTNNVLLLTYQNKVL